MTTFLFLLSAMLFQLPFGMYQETLRRFKRMELYNPDKSLNYKSESGKLIANLGIQSAVFFSGFTLALLPLFLGLSFNWIILITGNILCLYFVTPFIAYIIYPIIRIKTISALKFKTIQFIVPGAVCLFIALAL